MSAVQPHEPKVPRFADDGTGAQMGFFDHLDELRSRLIRVFVLLILMLIAASFFVSPLLEYLIVPCDCKLTTLKPTDSVVVYFRVALMSAGIVVAPYATLELLLFILPGLTGKERRIVLTALPVIVILFLVGVLFAWFILIPTAIPFLQDFMGSVLEAEWTADNYIAFITSLLFWMGVAFEMPVVFFVLGRIGIIGPGVLIRNWRLAVVLITIAAALITPTVDPFNMTLVILPLLGLYAFSILMTAIAYRRRLAAENA
ncbi:MAG: twin-arginine translocase subunit TatC [Anaerolineae bacterium]|jgi:sec-independent protein translocase protein TatC|nr:MAG: twin-arginine translocase subunit TatC [Anaerolineae bacterium]MCL4879537.1 twin-arginine translocase subunit TatC [Anaerolineae bacterium]